jgi:hypothetical protein
MLLDIGVVLFLIYFTLKSNYLLLQRSYVVKAEYIFLQILAIYHFIFTLVFSFYLQENGGDAIAYWNVHYLTSKSFEEWKAVWGTSTFFIELLNYIPSQILKLNFITGNFIYSALTFVGLRTLFLIFRKHFEPVNSSMKWILFSIVFFLPNLHFWTSGVTKEALLFFSISQWLLFLNEPVKNLKNFYLAIGISLMTRPVVGVLFILFSAVVILINRKEVNVSAFLPAVFLGILFSYLVFQLSHIDQIGWEGVAQYQNQQFEFLNEFKADSFVAMETYPIYQQIFTLLFEPFFVLGKGPWYFMASLENLLSFSICVYGLISFFIKPTLPPRIIIIIVLFLLVINGIHLLSVNNLGIMLRLKSPFMIFIHWIAAYFIFKADFKFTSITRRF